MESLSLVVIAFNESRNIERCLNSAKAICSEMVVVDSGSTDNTVELAQAFGARVVHQPFLGYIEQKNFAISQASSTWVLSLDADEELDEELMRSIQTELQNPRHSAYSMNRVTQLGSQWIRHGGWYPDRKIRLFKKGYGQWEGINPHDKYTLPGNEKAYHLIGDIKHYSFASFEAYKAQIDHFSRVSAEAQFKLGKRSSRIKMLLKPAARFIISLFFFAGFLEGRAGWFIAVYSAKYTYLKYKRLYDFQRKEK